jgi:hypothetical protein
VSSISTHKVSDKFDGIYLGDIRVEDDVGSRAQPMDILEHCTAFLDE